MEKKKTIMFIHGYGASTKGSGEKKRLASVFTEYEIIGTDYSQTNPVEGIKTLEEFIGQKNPDLIIGCSLGAFFTLQLKADVKKVVVNPCMLPSVELPALPKKNPGDKPIEASAYGPFEDTMIRKTYHDEEKSNIVGFFGNNDELFRYKGLFTKLLGNGNNTHSFSSGHHIEEEGWQLLKPRIVNFMNQ